MVSKSEIERRRVRPFPPDIVYPPSALVEAVENVVSHLTALSKMESVSWHELLFDPAKMAALRAHVAGIDAEAVRVQTTFDSASRAAVRSAIIGSREYLDFQLQVEAMKRSLMNLIAGRWLEIGLLFIRALHSVNTRIVALTGDVVVDDGWIIDGVPSGAIASDALRDRLLAVVESDILFDRVDLSACSSIWPILVQISRIQLVPVRAKTRLTAGVINVCNPDVLTRITLSQHYLHRHHPDGPPRELTVPQHEREQMLIKSAMFLERRSPGLSGGLTVKFSDSDSVGDGVRRAWFDIMVAHYFRPIDPDSAVRSDLTMLWEYSDDSRSAIRPRSMENLHRGAQDRMAKGLMACGRLIGLGIKHNIVPGIQFSPAVLALLQSPRHDWDYDSLSMREDSAFWTSLENMRSTNLSDPESVESLANVDSEIVWTSTTVEAYVRRKKFEKVVTSIDREMHELRGGIHDVIRRGILDLLTPTELREVIAGPPELTAAMVLAGTQFIDHVDADIPIHVALRLNSWLTSVVTEMSSADLARFVKFVTGSPRPPIDSGMAWITIKANPFVLETAMPTSSTCMHVIRLPLYTNRAMLEEKLLTAIRETGTLEEY